MNLDEAREVFQYGSRWSDGHTTRTVVGWADIGGYCQIVTATPQGALARYRADQALVTWARIPNTPPCPVTSPTRIFRRTSADGSPYWTPSNNPEWLGSLTGESVTLHPPEVDYVGLGTDQYGYYTWGDQ